MKSSSTEVVEIFLVEEGICSNMVVVEISWAVVEKSSSMVVVETF